MNYLNENSFLVGKCDRFCSLAEEKLRKKENLLNFYEKKYGIVVAEFKRSAADSKRNPDELRTFNALKKSLEYLFNRILHDTQKPLNFRYDYIFDRCRAIRQEVVVQNFGIKETIELLEPIVLFLSYSLYRMSGFSISQFDAKICKQHLQECLMKCLSCYDELDAVQHELSDKNRYKIQKRLVIESIYMMINMSEASALQRALKLDINIKSSYMIKSSIDILIAYHQREFYKVIKSIQKLPHPIVCSIASLQLTDIRKEVLRMFSIAYNSQSLKVPLVFLQRLLVYDELKTLLTHLRDNLGIHDVEKISNDSKEDNEDAIRFDRKKFDSSKMLPFTSQQFVNEKFTNCNLTDLFLFDSF